MSTEAPWSTTGKAQVTQGVQRGALLEAGPFNAACMTLDDNFLVWHDKHGSGGLAARPIRLSSSFCTAACPKLLKAPANAGAGNIAAAQRRPAARRPNFPRSPVQSSPVSEFLRQTVCGTGNCRVAFLGRSSSDAGGPI